VVAATAATAVLEAQESRSAAGRTSACSLLTVQEIKTLLGERTPRLIDMIPPSEEQVGSGSECFIATIILQLDVIPVGNFSSNMQTYASRTTFESLTGVGDEAYFYEQQPGSASHVVGVYARIAQHVLVVSMDVEDGDTAASLRPDLLALTRAAEAKLRR
jgi:hypothetical protein